MISKKALEKHIMEGIELLLIDSQESHKTGPNSKPGAWNKKQSTRARRGLTPEGWARYSRSVEIYGHIHH